MKIVVIGGSGLIGSKVVGKLNAHGHEVVAASPNSGVNTITGEGLAEVLVNADVVVDVSNSPSFADDDVMAFFTTSTANLLAAEKSAGVTHHVALSIVGADRLPGSGYMRAKVAQEKLIVDSGVAYSIVRATQFLEFATGIAASAADGDTVRLPHSLTRPIAAEDVATTVARTAAAPALNGTLEIAGPNELPLDVWIRTALELGNDPRTVVSDPEAPYFGVVPAERDLVPGDSATFFTTSLEEWFPGEARA
jgi:uncharacterized protein YbjT (DUF2867 family)